MTKVQMEMIKDFAADTFWGGVLTALAIPILLKIVYAFVSFIKWIFRDYFKVRNDVANINIKMNAMDIEIIKIKTLLIKIEKKLHISE